MSNPERLPPVQADAGYYLVPDPDRPARLTAWEVDGRGRLHRFPRGHRWEPVCPAFDEIADWPQRRKAREEWYRTKYWVWKRRVVKAIEWAPPAAAAAFARAFPSVIVAQRQEERRQADERRRRAVDELRAAAWSAAGMSTRRIAGELGGTSWATARTRIEAGRLLWSADSAAARRALVDHYRLLTATLDVKVDVEALVDHVARAIAPEGVRDRCSARPTMTDADSGSGHDGPH